MLHPPNTCRIYFAASTNPPKDFSFSVVAPDYSVEISWKVQNEISQYQSMDTGPCWVRAATGRFNCHNAAIAMIATMLNPFHFSKSWSKHAPEKTKILLHVVEPYHEEKQRGFVKGGGDWKQLASTTQTFWWTLWKDKLTEICPACWYEKQ